MLSNSRFSVAGRLTMSIELAENLKRELTDKWVVVAENVPELRRFSELTGKVKTVNMNCRALVEFDGPEDIGWYDIDPQFLTVVDGPRPKAKPEPKAAKPATKSKPAAKPSTGGGSPLDQIRSSGASKPAGGSPLDQIRAGAAPKAAAKPAAGGSPLDQIRASSGGTKEANVKKEVDVKKEADAENASADAASEVKKEAPAKPAATGSPLDQIRSQGGFKG